VSRNPKPDTPTSIAHTCSIDWASISALLLLKHALVLPRGPDGHTASGTVFLCFHGHTSG
jgi:hypothetical protein